MKILYVAHNHPPVGAPLKSVGGMQRVSLQLLKELKKRSEIEVETAVLSTSWENIAFDAFVFLLEQYFRLPVQARESRADVILFSSMVTASLAYFIRHKVEIPMVTINHGKDVTLPVAPYQWFLPKVFESLDGVISVSRATRQACLDRGMDPGKGVALGNGIDLERLQVFPDRQSSKEELSKQFGMDLRGKQMLLTVGRQVRRKGHEWFIRNVFPRLRDDIIYVAIGDGPEQKNIRRAVEEVGGSERIYLLGRQPEEVLKRSYAAADLFVMPNIPVAGDMEGFGIVLLEANMARTPAVAADLEGIRDVILDGQNGYRVPPLNGDAFVDKINHVLNNGLSDFSNKTRKYVLEKFSWEHIAGEYLEFISGVIKKYNRHKNINEL